MSWNYRTEADIGLFRDLYNCSVSGVTPEEINDAMAYRQATPVETQINIDPDSGELASGEISQGLTKTLFGFALKQNDVFTHKYAVCRAYASVYALDDGNVKKFFQIHWDIYDELAGTYTNLTPYFIETGVGQVGSIKWNAVKVMVGFKKARMNYHGEDQLILYGGLFCYANDSSNYGTDYQYYSIGLQGIGTKYHLGQYDEVNPEEILTNPDFGPASEPGGYGPTEPGGSGGGAGGPAPTFDAVSDTWADTPVKPGVLTFGLLNIYKCDQGSLNNLGAELFPTITYPPAPSETGVTDWIKWCGEVGKWFTNVLIAFSNSIWNKGLIDYIVSVHLIPVDVTGGALEDIKLGPRTMTGILARPITNDVIEFNCGTIHIDEYYTNYVDYMTRCRVYIPFYGMVAIKPEYWQSADLQLKYLWNVMDGSFIAKLYSTINRHQKPCTVMIGQYSGSACVHMPLSGANYASMFSQLAGAAGSMAMGAATGNVAVPAQSAMTLIGNSSGDMQSSNAYNASSAFYGHACPFVVIERPISHFSEKYVDENGLPLLQMKRIGDCQGLTICDNPILNFACTDEEAKEIIAALKEGVIV